MSIMDIVELAKDLMYKQTEKNKAPAWLLTEIAINKGKELSKKYDVDEKLVFTSLYLAHTIFDEKSKKNHPELSAEFVKKYLNKWDVDKEDQDIIINAIKAHHGKVPTKSKIAEVMKNAECFKFVTVKGSLVWLHTLGLRQYSYDEAVERVIQKMEEKRSLLTFDDCISEAEIECNKIRKMFSS